MRIVSLHAENVKKLRVVDITPNKYVNRISGANGSGKTSVLESIEWALTGAKNIPSMPVRRGSSRAVIALDLGDVIVTRKMIEGSPKRQGVLTVESKDGKKWNNPDEMLRSLLSAVTFDPLEFIHMKPNNQYDILRNIAMPDVDLDELEAKIKEDYDARRMAKGEHADLEANLNAIEPVPAELPTQKIDESKLVAELQTVAEFNAGIETERIRRKQIQNSHDEATEAIIAKKKELENLRAEIERMESEKKETLKTIAGWKPLADSKDSHAIAERINEARGINRGIDRKVQIDAIQKKMDAKKSEIAKLDESYKRGELRHREAIALAKFPVEGLGFGNKEVLYNGMPFEQASNSEQIKVSVGIGMANHPKLRVMRIKDGSLLDDKSLDLIANMAKAEDFQIWIEQVDTTGKIGVYLEDGEIKTVNEEPKEVLTAPTADGKKKTRTSKKNAAQRELIQ